MMKNAIPKSLIILLLLMLFHKIATQSYPRSLGDASSKCSEYSNCTLWNSDSSWLFMNSYWGAYSGDFTLSTPYSQETEYSFWKNAIPSGYLDLRNNSTVIELSKTDNSVDLQHQIWEWNLIISNSTIAKIEIQRDWQSYEDILISASTLNSSKVYTSKELNSCLTNSVELNLRDIQYLQVRVRALSSKSNYKIFIRQENTNSSTAEISKEMRVIIGVAAGIFAFMMLMLFFYVLYWIVKPYMLKKSQSDKHNFNNIFDNSINHNNFDQSFWDCMKREIFKNVRENMKNNVWMICLECFEDNSDVYISNEWRHILLHHKCLKEWLKTKRNHKFIGCPYWVKPNNVFAWTHSNKFHLSDSDTL